MEIEKEKKSRGKIGEAKSLFVLSRYPQSIPKDIRTQSFHNINICDGDYEWIIFPGNTCFKNCIRFSKNRSEVWNETKCERESDKDIKEIT